MRKKIYYVVILICFIGCDRKPLIDRIVGISTESSGSSNPPVIIGISPSPMVMGENITVTGNYFGDSQGNSFIQLNNVTLSGIISWNDNAIVFTLPSSGERPGDLTITTPYGTGIFAVEVIKIVSVYPNNSLIDAGVTIQAGETITMEASGLITVDSCSYEYDSTGYSFPPNGSLGTDIECNSNIRKWLFVAAEPRDNNSRISYVLFGQTYNSAGNTYEKFSVGSVFTDSGLSGSLRLGVNTWTGDDSWPTPDSCSGYFSVIIRFQ